jgi:hypothetical protein
MRTLVLVIVIIGVALALFSHLRKTQEEKIAREKAPDTIALKRVNLLMEQWKEGGSTLNDAAQARACVWARGTKVLASSQEIMDAVNSFDMWRRKKNVPEAISSYEVGAATRKTSSNGDPYTSVAVTIDGNHYALGVPDGDSPIFWAE